MRTVFQKYPQEKRAFINPEDLTKQNPDFPALCVSTFSFGIIDKLASLDSVENNRPLIYRKWKCTRLSNHLQKYTDCFLFVASRSARLYRRDRRNYCFGGEKIVLFGSCGILDNSADNKIIIPTSAVRDEGTSYHYLKATDEVFADQNSINKMTKCLENCGYPYIKGKTWTTDAIYRETESVIAERKKARCICVEMECAAALAVTQFREIPFAQFLYSADNLDSPKWEPRDLTEYGLSNAEKYMVLAFECAINL